jgi:hypothetical protein
MSDPVVIHAQPEDDPYTMANLRPDRTGLPMVVWVSERGNAQQAPSSWRLAMAGEVA